MSLFKSVSRAGTTIEDLTRGDDDWSHGMTGWVTWSRPGKYSRRPAEAVNFPDDPETATLYRSYVEQIEQPFPAIKEMYLRDATILGQGTVVLKSGKLLIDTCREILLQSMLPIPLDDFAKPLPQSITHSLTEPSLLLKRPWWHNYGHWLVDVAALLALGEGRLHGIKNVIIGQSRDPVFQAIMAETLAILAPHKRVLEHGDHDVWACKSLHVVTPIHQSPLMKHPAAFEALRQRLLNQAGVHPDKNADRKLFALRPSRNAETSGRALVNEAEILAICKSAGFETIRPERMTLLEQVRAFRECSILVGVKGAAITNALFMPPGSAVLVFSPDDWPDPFFWDLVSQHNISYHEMFGALTKTASRIGQNPFIINKSTFSQRLRSLLPQSSFWAVPVAPDAASLFLPPRFDTPGELPYPASPHDRSLVSHNCSNRGEAMFDRNGQTERPRLTGTIIYEGSKWWFETSAYRNAANPLQGPFDSIKVACDFALERRRAVDTQSDPHERASVDYRDPTDLPPEFASWHLLDRDRWTYTNMRKGIIYRCRQAWWFEPYAVFDRANPISGPYLTLEEAVSSFR